MPDATMEYQTNSGASLSVEIRKGKVIKGIYQPQVFSPDLQRGWNLPIHVIEARRIKPEDIQEMSDAQYNECLEKLGLSAPADGGKENKKAAGETAADDIISHDRDVLKAQAKELGIKVIKSDTVETLKEKIEAASEEEEEE